MTPEPAWHTVRLPLDFATCRVYEVRTVRSQTTNRWGLCVVMWGASPTPTVPESRVYLMKSGGPTADEDNATDYATPTDALNAGEAYVASLKEGNERAIRPGIIVRVLPSAAARRPQFLGAREKIQVLWEQHDSRLEQLPPRERIWVCTKHVVYPLSFDENDPFGLFNHGRILQNHRIETFEIKETEIEFWSFPRPRS